jgi:hypothetical protein
LRKLQFFRSAFRLSELPRFKSLKTFEMNIHLNKILRLTYRRNFPNNTDKIWGQSVLRGKLFTSRDLWEIDGEGIGAEKERKTQIRQSCPS